MSTTLRNADAARLHAAADLLHDIAVQITRQTVDEVEIVTDLIILKTWINEFVERIDPDKDD